ncbi:MAG: hypothetical protein KAH31_10395 [Candidatus Sabulitectum sp.]|nr:hypothetical protein [Candidatus Sabulitectum sp.]
MKKAIAILAVLSLTAFAGQFAVNLDPVERTDGDWLRYDSGTAKWLTWGGMYRGVWFNTEDFIPGMGGADVNESEFWFYHHASYPWDTSDVYIEIWNGDAMAPVTQIDQTMITAVHYAPVYATYATPLSVEANFWAIANTEMSAGGWPASLGDEFPENHSFYSDDNIIWEPWIGDYFVAVNVDPQALNNATWGSLKATF